MMCLLLVLLFLADVESFHNPDENITRDVGNSLIAFLNAPTNERILELNDRLKTVEQYIVDKDKIAELITNVTRQTNLNHTNFFKALTEDDHYLLQNNNESKSLYLKLKEKMNRDDILKVFVEKGGDTQLVKSARKMMGDDRLGKDDVIDNVVDSMIAETASDDHKFEARANDSMYWDPQGELEDLKEYHRHDGRRLYKGERTTVRYYPFMVSIQVMGRFWCGGVIYWHDLVLTSAACLQLMHNNRFFRENPRVLQVRIGSNHSRLGGEVLDALEVYFHPAYNPRTLRNNIAVIRLRKHLYFNYHRIPKVIAISHNAHSLPATAEVLLLGWGVTKMSQKLSYEPVFLQRKFLPIYPNAFCKEVYGDKFITSSMFCAGTFTTGEGACDHDAGGPAILSGKLVGIISFGPAVCGFPNVPTVFTLVGAYADWIETINETMPLYYRGNKRTTTTTHSPLVAYFNTWVQEPATTTGVNPLVVPTTIPHEPVITTRPTSPALRRGDEETDGNDGNDGWSIDLKK
ncbi:hypothetical protein O3G_MSEX007876 [Manduca sexta]|uniref:Peptidase S1 domain-containing protein n=1 Tax=Manduca sexta TaxID=7130 RepID=A0A921Z7U0_MANSE|nr:hypothetical protein O3G_MSEX007876 [Manduca sexta]